MSQLHHNEPPHGQLYDTLYSGKISQLAHCSLAKRKRLLIVDPVPTSAADGGVCAHVHVRTVRMEPR